MHLLRLSGACLALLFVCSVDAQLTVSRGARLSVDATQDGRIAIDLQGDIWIVPGGGGNARQVTQNLRTAQRPRWSPDTSTIVYQAGDGRQQIWIHELQTGATKNLSNAKSYDIHPEWHADGKRLIYASDTDGSGFDLWEVDVPTGVRWRITQLAGDELEPAWSADGRDLVYIHHKGDQWALMLRRHAQPDEVLVSSTNKIGAPSWRPDSSLITFFRDDESGTSIEMVILSQPRLIRSYATGEQFVVAPISWLDRQHMVYSANGEVRQRLFESWRSTPLRFRATIQADAKPAPRRARIPLPWTDEPLGQLIIHAARMFDGVSSTYIYDKDIVISGGRIRAIEDHADRPGKIVINMGDLTVLPGYIDADARLPGELSASHGPDLLAAGITTVVATTKSEPDLNTLWSGKDVPGPRLLDARSWQVGPLAKPEHDVTAAVVTSRTTGLMSGAALPTQFRAMQIAGLSAEQTLRAIGVNAAAAMLADPYLGRIATGAGADLVFVDGDPLTEISAALNVVAVVRNGRFFSVSGLFDRAKKAENVE